jgi:hypothetical protein
MSSIKGDNMKFSKIKLVVFCFVFFVVTFGLIFLPFPLHQSFIGNIDIWFYVWQWNDYFNHITHSSVPGQVLYPEENYRALVDSAFGYGIIFSVFKAFVRSDIWVFYLVLVSILSLNSIAFTLILNQFKIPIKISAVMAFCLFANNFVLSNLENFNAYTFFPGFLAIYIWLKVIRSRSRIRFLWLVISGLLVGAQIYYSIYLFLFQFVFWLVLILSMGWERRYIGAYFIMFGSMLLMVFPFFSQRQELSDYLQDPVLQDMLFKSNESHSIFFMKDWIRVNVGNLIYPAMTDIQNPWRYGARSAFFGFSTYGLFFISVFYFWKKGKGKLLFWVGLLLFIAMMLSTGPMLRTPHYSFITPIGWVNEWLPGTLVIRHLFRAHLLTIAGSLFLIAMFFKEINVHHTRMVNICLVFFLVVFSIENIPFKAAKYQSSHYTQPPNELVDVLKMVPEESKLFFLPSCQILDSESQITTGFNPMNREYIYMAWKNRLPYNIFNGRMGYLTNTGYNNTLLTCDLTTENYQKLMADNDIDYFVLVRDFVDERFLEKTLPTILEQTTMISPAGRFQVHEPR